MKSRRERVPISEIDPRQALSELKLYHEELEIQNKELQIIRQQNEILINKYTALYDHAPSGYFTLDKRGKIQELNLTALTFFDQDRSVVLNTEFREYISPETRLIYDEFFKNIFERDSRISCDAIFFIPGKTSFYAHLEGISTDYGQNCFLTVADITVLKKTEEALKLSRKEFQSYFENGSVGMSVYSPEKGWIELNQKLCQMFGYSRRELIGQKWMDFSHPDDLAANLYYYQQALEGKLDRYQMDKRFIRKDGSILFATLCVAIQRNDDGTIHHLLSTYIDITEHKQLEIEIKQSEEKLRSLLEFAPDAFFHGDSEGKFIMVNDKAVEYTGYSTEELLEMNIADLFTEEVLKKKPLRYDLAKTGLVITTQREVTRKDGSTIQVSMRAKMMPDGTFQCLMTDVTGRVKAETALKESEERFRSLFEDSRNPIILADFKSGIIINANHAASKLLGRSTEEIVGMHYLNLHPENDREELRTFFQERAKNPGKGLPAQPAEMKVVRSDGKELPVEVITEVIYLNGKSVLHRTYRDISKRKRREEELRKSEMRFSLFFENMVDGLAHCRMLYEKDQPEDFIYLDVNPAFERITSLKNVKGKKVSEAIPGIRQSDPEMFDIYSRVALTGKPEEREIFVKALDKWFHIAVFSPVKEQFVVVFDDVTERKLAEESLRESEERFHALFENSPSAIFLADVETGIIIDANHSAGVLTGKPINELIGIHQSKLHPERFEEEAKTIFRNHIKGSNNNGKMISAELPVKKEDGTEVPVEIHATIIGLNGRKVVYGIFHDLSARKTEKKKSDHLI